MNDPASAPVAPTEQARDARRYHVLRAVMCAAEDEMERVAGIMDEVIGARRPTPEVIDQAVDAVIARRA